MKTEIVDVRERERGQAETEMKQTGGGEWGGGGEVKVGGVWIKAAQMAGFSTECTSFAAGRRLASVSTISNLRRAVETGRRSCCRRTGRTSRCALRSAGGVVKLCFRPARQKWVGAGNTKGGSIAVP